MKIMDLACEMVAKRLQEYLDGELQPWTRMLIRMHLKVCARCSHRCQFYQALADGLRRKADEMRPPEILRVRLLSIIRPGENSRSSQ